MWSVEKKGMSSSYIDVVNDMYDIAVEQLRERISNNFLIIVSLHYGSAINPKI